MLADKVLCLPEIRSCSWHDMFWLHTEYTEYADVATMVVQTMQGVCIRQPAISCWQPHGVGQVSCSTKLTFQQSKQRKGQVISGPAAMELMRLQLQYLIFLKQSNAATSLTQEPQQYIKL
jgi:hypothetical protein